MKIKIAILIFFVGLISCQDNNKINSKAMVLHKRASEIFKKNPINEDSLNYAILLLDSAISLDPNQLRIFFTKSQISMRLKKYDLVINSCDRILSIDKNNFYAFLEKGVATELAGHKDSAIIIYNKTLETLETTRFQNLIFKEYERIVLYGLLQDTTNFNLKLKQFKNKFDSEKEFSDYYQDLLHFNRVDYINSY